MKVALFASALLAASAIAAPAQAATYAFDFGTYGMGTFTTSDTATASGAFAITGVTGTSFGSAITGLVNNPNSPASANYTTNASGAVYTFNNLYLANNSLKFDGDGLLFTTTNRNVNLYSFEGQYRVASNVFGSRLDFNLQPISGTIAAVPEPAAWAMMLVGFGMVGAASRYRRRGAKVSFA